MTNKEAAEWVIGGNRLAIPPDTPPRIQALMNKCWNFDPQNRPTFVEISPQKQNKHKRVTIRKGKKRGEKKTSAHIDIKPYIQWTISTNEWD
jgi:hypothetical protein